MSTHKKRILVLAHSPFIGGGELALKSLIDSTIDQYTWTVVVPDAGSINEKIKSYGVNFIALPALAWWCYEAHDRPAHINKSKLSSSLAALTSLAKDADILLTNTITIPWLGFIAQKINKPHIWYVHEYGDLDHNLQFIAGYDNSLRMISASSSRILTISSAVKEHLGRIIPLDKIDIIHQSINLSDFVGMPVASNFNNLSILCMGAIKPSKGQLIALEAVSKLKNATLDIIGPAADQKYAEQIKREAEKYPSVSVDIRGYDPVKELSSHNVVLMCSENEGLGRVTLESLASGRLVVGYNCRSTGELLANDRGIVYPLNNSESLRDAIESIIHSSAKDNLEAARAYVVDTFSSKAQSDDFNKCIEKALSSKDLSGNLLDDYIDILNQLNIWESSSRKIKLIVKRLVPSAVKTTFKRFRGQR